MQSASPLPTPLSAIQDGPKVKILFGISIAAPAKTSPSSMKQAQSYKWRILCSKDFLSTCSQDGDPSASYAPGSQGHPPNVLPESQPYRRSFPDRTASSGSRHYPSPVPYGCYILSVHDNRGYAGSCRIKYTNITIRRMRRIC